MSLESVEGVVLGEGLLPAKADSVSVLSEEMISSLKVASRSVSVRHD